MDVWDGGAVLASLKVESVKGVFMIGIRSYLMFEVPLLVVIGKMAVEVSSLDSNSVTSPTRELLVDDANHGDGVSRRSWGHMDFLVAFSEKFIAYQNKPKISIFSKFEYVDHINSGRWR